MGLVLHSLIHLPGCCLWNFQGTSLSPGARGVCWVPTSSSEQASITVTMYLEGPTKASRRLSPLTTRVSTPIPASRATTLPGRHGRE